MRAPTAAVATGRVRQVRRAGGEVWVLMPYQEIKIGVAMGQNERDRIVLVLSCGLSTALSGWSCPDAVLLRPREDDVADMAQAMHNPLHLTAMARVGCPVDQRRSFGHNRPG